MARARDPNRDKAFEIYKEHNGDITNRAIAEMLGVPEKTIGSWKSKSKDNWNEQLNGVLQSGERSTPIKNKSNKSNKKVVESEEIIELESDDFTDKQRLFISYYVKYWNATKAYQKAYNCAYTTAMVEGSRLLRNPKIRDEVVKVRDGLTEDALLDKRTLIQKWIDIAFADITDYLKFGRQEEIEYEDDGQPKLDMNGNVKTYAFNYVHLNESDEIDGTLVTEVKQGKDGITVKLADKMKALEFLSKHVDLLNDNERKQLQTEQMRFNIDKTKEEIKRISAQNTPNTATEDKLKTYFEALQGAFKNE
ncbi:terminase small subunit [Metasolibacillus meyeri]|uniref:terminase small subunit n=1 Tax=Metasolibacillus meyeri TaxID=1071052 RepID=UPI000D2F7EB9|nr:terminase small subunit [Metasolibacillus meyeri]